MLDRDTKKRIDDLRNILVGKTPSPQSQVEQITTGLIYKFMYDMDTEAVEMDGVPSFFVGDYEKYSWKHLFNPKLGGADKVQLYSDAIENMYTNPTAPSLFREIFKNSYLPFKDANILNMFIKEINEFHYSDSEILGDAYEYLISFLGSQGEAGQFRTPRHIINFIVDIVNPQKNETILDPACGTGGFLVSSYKYILNQNTDTRLGDQLNAAERRIINDNLVGYDIDPTFIKISLVNLHLHKFTNPQINEYDTLSSEDRWNEYYDVILANPPFFSPTGGIQPHSRFGVQSTRAEVLFVDYIMEHLKPSGRAGIIVPEGIVFQTGIAYKTLRKKLVEDCLVGVISLPAGVFEPYSGVKTSILILDKELNQKRGNIFFAKVENDGFSLSKQRTPITKNDLPELLGKIKGFFEGKPLNDENFWTQTKNEVLLNNIHSLVGGNYREVTVTNTDWELVSIGEICEINSESCNPDEIFGDSSFIYVDISSIENGTGKIHLGNHIPTDGAPSRAKRRVSVGDVLVSSVRPNLKGFGLVNFDTSEVVVSTGFLVLSPSSKVLPQYLLRNLLSDNCIQQMSSRMGRGNYPSINSSDIKEIKIPLPPIEIQQQIVDELEGYQKLIDGCRQVVENYKPTIDLDPSWEMIEVGDLVDVNNGNTLTKFDDEGELAGIKVSDMNLQENQVEIVTSNNRISSKRFNEKHTLQEGSVVFPKRGAAIATNKKRITRIPCVIDNNCMALTVRDSRLIPEYLFNFLCGFDLTTISKSAGVALINNPDIKGVNIPLPSIEVQQGIIERIDDERAIVRGNERFIEIYTQKIQDRISKIWG
jgi:type I restriction enzyme M protein